MTPAFTVFVPSAGRPNLRHTLDSFDRQAREPGDRCVVVFDAHQASPYDLLARMKVVDAYPQCIATLYDAGYHWFGVEQINYGMRLAERDGFAGTHYLLLGDDDIFVDGAFARLRPVCAAEPGRAVIYRFLTPPTTPDGRPWRELLWDRPTLEVSHISGCCLAAPRAANVPVPTDRYVEHDYDWICEVVANTAVAPLWLEDPLVIARPEPDGRGGVKHAGLWRCPVCGDWGFLEDSPGPTCLACGKYPTIARERTSCAFS